LRGVLRFDGHREELAKLPLVLIAAADHARADELRPLLDRRRLVLRTARSRTRSARLDIAEGAANVVNGEYVAE